MRILHWASHFPPCVGGIETQVKLLAEEQVRRGHDVGVITSYIVKRDAPAQERLGGVDIHRWPLLQGFMTRDLVLIARLRNEVAAVVKSFGAAVHHLHLPGTIGFYAEPLIARLRLPLVVTMHATADQRVNGDACGILLRAANRVSAVSRATCLTLAQYEIAPGKLVLIPNGLPIEPEAAATSASRPHVVALGRIVRDKGFDVFIDALAQLVGAGHDLVATIAGEGPELDRLMTQARALGLESRVSFPGPLDRAAVLALYREASVVVMPSRWEEPFGLVALEAQIAGRPIVASNVGGVPEFVVDGVTGLLVPKEDPAALARAIERVLAEPELARTITQAARAAAIAQFSIERCAADYEALYREVAEERRA